MTDDEAEKLGRCVRALVWMLRQPSMPDLTVGRALEDVLDALPDDHGWGVWQQEAPDKRF